jgi:hypothetical protein
MKKLFGSYLFSKKNFLFQQLFNCPKSFRSQFAIALLSFGILLQGCSKQHTEIPEKDAVVNEQSTPLDSDEEFLDAYQNKNSGSQSVSGTNQGFSFLTFLELLEARAATIRYRQFSNALADGYADINVVVPNMGYHYMKSSLSDSKFEIRKPEILVYNKKRNGSFELLAVEYAVPISITPNTAPEGFTGPADVWERNTDFGLWLLHAWIWEFNPEGVFHHTNPLVQVR